jgi:hypothetical protein
MWDNATSPPNPEYVGIAGITEMGTGSVINNSVYIYPSGQGWADSTQYNFLSGDLSFSSASADSDWSLVIATEELSTAPGDKDTVIFAFLWGDNATDFIDAVEDANEYESVYLLVNEQSSGASSNAITISPNPFNNGVNIQFGNTQVYSVEIYDTFGRKVEVIETYRETVVSWIPKNLQSGVYMIKANTSNGIITQKTLYIK